MRQPTPRRWARALALLPLVLATSAASGGPARLLRAAETADQRQSYVGVRVVRAFGGEKEKEQRVRVSHLAPDRTRIEYLSPEGGNVLLENGNRRWFYSPRRGSWWPIEWHPSRSRLELLLQNYRVRHEGFATVAGRRVVQLVIEPRYSGNPSKRVWIDPASRMTLREEVRTYDGRLIASSAFEQLELVRELSAELFEPPPTPEARTETLPPLPFAPLRPHYLPPGYREVRQSSLRRGPREGIHLRYTDGLGTISLFQFRARPDGSSEERGRRGEGGPPWRRWNRPEPQGRLSRQIGDLNCTAIGDIAPDELKKLLDSLPDRPPGDDKVAR